MVRCKNDKGAGANSGNFGGTLTNGLVGTRADGWEIWGNFPKNYPGPTGWSWDNSGMEPGNAHAHFLFPVFCAAWR